MKILKVYGDRPDHRALDMAVEALRAGEVIIYPTDTIYALGCDALSQRAVERVCRLKGINPERQRLSILCSDMSQAADYVRIDNPAYRLMKEYLPGPYTFILPTTTRLPKAFKGRKEAGVRIPGCAVARQIAERLGNPLLTTTIEWDDDDPYSGSDPDAIAMRYEAEASLMIDNGPGGTEPSTIISLIDSSSPELIRAGVGPYED